MNNTCATSAFHIRARRSIASVPRLAADCRRAAWIACTDLVIHRKAFKDRAYNLGLDREALRNASVINSLRAQCRVIIILSTRAALQHKGTLFPLLGSTPGGLSGGPPWPSRASRYSDRHSRTWGSR